MESIREMIEKRAYHLFLKRNGAHGYHMQDWVQAEKEIKAELEAKKRGEAKQTLASKAEPTKAVAAPASTTKVTAPPPSPAPAAKSNPAVKGRNKGYR